MPRLNFWYLPEKKTELICTSTRPDAGSRIATISGFLKSTFFPVSTDTAFPTSRFTSDLKGSGSVSERSLQTISSFSAISGGTLHPMRNVEYSIPLTACTTRSAHSGIVAKKLLQTQQVPENFVYGWFS